MTRAVTSAEKRLALVCLLAQMKKEPGHVTTVSFFFCRRILLSNKEAQPAGRVLDKRDGY